MDLVRCVLCEKRLVLDYQYRRWSIYCEGCMVTQSWLPSYVKEVSVNHEMRCFTCPDGPKRVLFDVEHRAMFPWFPDKFDGCLGGCDQILLDVLGIFELNSQAAGDERQGADGQAAGDERQVADGQAAGDERQGGLSPSRAAGEEHQGGNPNQATEDEHQVTVGDEQPPDEDEDMVEYISGWITRKVIVCYSCLFSILSDYFTCR